VAFVSFGFASSGATDYIFAATYHKDKDLYVISTVLSQYDSVLLTDDASLSDAQLMTIAESNQRVKDLQVAYPSEVLYADYIKNDYTWNSYVSRHYDASGALIDDTVVLHEQYMAEHPSAAAQPAAPANSASTGPSGPATDSTSPSITPDQSAAPAQSTAPADTSSPVPSPADSVPAAS
jgi:hypothetical protein